MIPQEDIDELKNKMPQVLEYYGITNLSRNFRSPWREDTDPSVRFYPDTNTLFDFGTGEVIDAFALVGKFEDIDCFPEQVRRVADIAGYMLGSSDGVNGTADRPPRKRFDPPEPGGFHPALPLAKFEEFRNALLQGGRALDYLHSRGFDNPKLYRNRFGLVENPKQVSQALTCYEPNAPHGFIVMPFPADKDFSEVQYVMLRPVPGEVPPIRKEMRPTGVTSILFREWLVFANCRVLYVTEGILDCLALEMLIGKPCLGLGGTNYVNRLSALLYYARPEVRPLEVVIVMDNDEPGRKAARKLKENLDDIGIPSRRVFMPAGFKDPCEYLERKVKGGGYGQGA